MPARVRVDSITVRVEQDAGAGPREISVNVWHERLRSPARLLHTVVPPDLARFGDDQSASNDDSRRSFMNNRAISKLVACASPLATLAFLSVSLGGCGAAEPGDVANSEPAATTSDALTITIGGTNSGLEYYQACTENNTCPNPGKRYVAYGAGGFYTFKSMTIGASFPCTNDFFGTDPNPGVHKACYYANYTHDVDLNQTGVVSDGPRTVAFGANGVFAFKTISGAYSCNTATFGSPISFGTNACYTALPGYRWAATEPNGIVTGLNNEPVAFGTNGRYFYKIVSGSINCNTGAFGDPLPNAINKQCFRLHASKDADENAGLGVPPGIPVYGSGLNGFYLPGPSSNGICSNAGFNGDPDIGQQKHCFLPF